MSKRKICCMLLCWLVAMGLVQACTGTENGGQPGSIAGLVYFDANANQICEDFECGIPDVSIRLYADTCGGRLVHLIKTDAKGYFEFSDMSPGAYCVYSALAPMCDGYLPTTRMSQAVELSAGEKIELEWFGYDLYMDSLKAENPARH